MQTVQAILLACLALFVQAASAAGTSLRQLQTSYNDAIADYNDAVSAAMTTYIVVIAIIWGLALVGLCVTIVHFQKKEAELPAHMKVLDGGMIAAWVLLSLCCGLLGFFIMFCVVSGRINDNLNMYRMTGGQQQPAGAVGAAKY